LRPAPRLARGPHVLAEPLKDLLHAARSCVGAGHSTMTKPVSCGVMPRARPLRAAATAVGLAAAASTLLPAEPSAAAGGWKYRSCGYIAANGLRNQVSSGERGTGGFVLPCRTARSVLRNYMRTGRTVGIWRCNRGGSNQSVLAQCRSVNLFIAVYDARVGE